ncbi:MAG: NHL repeat-containing protein [Planctomycetota bacterium]|jgi:uncharacterized delta-60 repeat protein
MKAHTHRVSWALLAAGLTTALAAGSAGSLDTTFGSDGIVRTTMNPYGLISGIAVQADAKIVAVGEDRWNGGEDIQWAVHRYATDGSLDSGFGSSGRVLLFGSAGDDRARHVAIDANGKIVVVGDHLRRVGGNHKRPKYERDVTVVRLNSDGSLDAGFGTSGQVFTDLGSADSGHAVAIQGDGRIVVAAMTSVSSGGGKGRKGKGGTTSGAFALIRYNANGSLDTGFGGGDGILIDDVTAGDDSVRFGAIAIQSTGKIVAGGFNTVDGYVDEGWIVTRYHTNGSVDTAFGSNGRVYGDFALGEHLWHLAVQSNDRIVVSGWGQVVDLGYEAIVARYGADGTLDTTFDTDGLATSGLSGDDLGGPVAIQSDGKIVLGADLYPGTTVPPADLAVLRFNANGSLDTGFGTGGVSETPDAGSRDSGYALAIDSSGRIVVGGFTTTDNTDPDWLLVRYGGG